MHLPPHPSGSPVEPTLALINVVFLLLLFFVVTGTIVYQHDRSILPPTSLLLTPGKAPADAVYVDAEGGLSFRGQSHDAAEIAQILRTDWPEEGEGEGEDGAVARTVQVVADRSLNARTLLSVVRTLRDQGLHSLSIVTVRDRRR
ncbi:MAG TPA: biopolymer transporter ExbD [Aestuariivirgaceae bacterium]|nr:biopolymer transporter ExbD [Aestuariivirgaceae bacterium]